MKVGIQTIAWGEDTHLHVLLPEMAREIATAGYEGIELFQATRDVNVGFVHDQLQANGLQLVGVTGGSFQERVGFIEEYKAVVSASNPYVYTDEWRDAELQDAIRRGITVAIHPHMFKPIQTVAEAVELLRKHSWASKKQLRLLPDSAHQEIAGEPIMDVLRRHMNWIDNVHLKDWTPECGRSYQFYAQGFVPLGQGDVPLVAVLDYLKNREFSGWLIVEQDVTDSAYETARDCREWLREQEL
ncbi:MAG: sugar phosphate isomerase/epimerase family protein [Planctomycetota bacterium]|jgi:sugar phosphate isomerase/epimerase